MCHAFCEPFEEEDVVAMVRKVFDGRVTFHDGVDEIAPGITVHKIGGHSKGLQSIRVKTRRGYVVLASDATHLYAHIEGGRVFRPPTISARCWRATRRSSGSRPRRHIIPGHDPAVLDRYPPAKPGLEGWVVRLDVEPKLA